MSRCRGLAAVMAERKDKVSPGVMGLTPAQVGGVPPPSLLGSCCALPVHPLRVLEVLAGAQRPLSWQRGGDPKQSEFPGVSLCLRHHHTRPCSTIISQGARGCCLAVEGAGMWEYSRLEPRRAESGAEDGEQSFGGPRMFWGRSESGGGV